MKLCVIGASGLMGRSLVARLADDKDLRTTAIARNTPAASRRPGTEGGVQWLRADLNSPADCERAVADQDVILHLAHTHTPLTSDADMASDAALNLIPTLNLPHAVKESGRTCHLIYPSSAVQRALKRMPIAIIGDPGNVRDYIHIDDVYLAFRACLTRRVGIEVFNIGTGVGNSVLEVVNVIERLTGTTAGRSTEAHTHARALVSRCVLDSSKARRELGWRYRIGLEDGIEAMPARRGASARPARRHNLGQDASSRAAPGCKLGCNRVKYECRCTQIPNLSGPHICHCISSSASANRALPLYRK